MKGKPLFLVFSVFNLCYAANNAMLAKCLSDFQGQIKKTEKIIVGRTINRWDSEEKAILPGNFQFSDKASSLLPFSGPRFLLQQSSEKLPIS